MITDKFHYFLLQVYLNLYFNFFWELYHPVRVFHWFDSIQNGIKVFGNQWFTALPTWMFFLCGQLILVYFKSIKNHLNNLVKKSSGEGGNKVAIHDIFKNLQCIKQLVLAVDYLHRRFSTILLATCFITALTLLSSAYFVINSIRKTSHIWGNCWEMIDVIDSIIRFWLLGYISDRMRQAVRISYMK